MDFCDVCELMEDAGGKTAERVNDEVVLQMCYFHAVFSTVFSTHSVTAIPPPLHTGAQQLWLHILAGHMYKLGEKWLEQQPYRKGSEV